MKELHELIKYLKDNGYEHLKINPDLLVGIIEYFASKQETKQCTITDVSQQRELLVWLKKSDLVTFPKDEINEVIDDYIFYQTNCG